MQVLRPRHAGGGPDPGAANGTGAGTCRSAVAGGPSQDLNVCIGTGAGIGTGVATEVGRG